MKLYAINTLLRHLSRGPLALNIDSSNQNITNQIKSRIKLRRSPANSWNLKEKKTTHSREIPKISLAIFDTSNTCIETVRCLCLHAYISKFYR